MLVKLGWIHTGLTYKRKKETKKKQKSMKILMTKEKMISIR